jgi:hypothetical protein
MDPTETPPEDQQEQDGSREIAKANLQGRALLAATIVLVLAFSACFRIYIFPFMELASSRAAAPDSSAIARALFTALGGLGIMTALAWILYARRIILHRQDPPPGAWLWRDTPIVRGKQALRRAWLSIATALILASACVACAAYVAQAFERITQAMLVPEPEPPAPASLPAPSSPARAPDKR